MNFRFSFLILLITTLLGFTLVSAWTGPTGTAPANNVSAPINVGNVNQTKNANLGVNGLAVFGNTLLGGIANSNAYLNFGATSGAAGYGFRDSGGVIQFANSGGSWAAICSGVQPSAITTFTSGSGTYTTPAGANSLLVKIVGGGGGGGGGNNNAAAGGNGGSSTFTGTGVALTAGGGHGGEYVNNIGTGGTATGGDINLTGGAGGQNCCSQSGVAAAEGGTGGSTVFGGAGAPTYGSVGGAGKANTGAGGAGGGVNASTVNIPAEAGGAGGYVEKLVTGTLAASYTYAVGAGGAGGAAAANGSAGGAGGSGAVIIYVYSSSASCTGSGGGGGGGIPDAPSNGTIYGRQNAAWVAVPAGGGGGGITMAGSNNYLTKITGASSIGQSIISDNGTTATVAGAFNVSGGGTSIYATAGSVRAAGNLVADQALTTGSTASIGTNLTVSGYEIISGNNGGDSLYTTTGNVHSGGGLIAATSLIVGTDATINGTLTLNGGAINSSGTLGISGDLQINGGGNAIYTPFGNVYSAGAMFASSFNQTSDFRLKKNIQPLAAGDGLAAVQALKPVTFTWKNPVAGAVGTQHGFIAQDVQQVLPDLVIVASSTPLTPGGTLTVNYTGMIPTLVEAMQQLNAKVDAQQKEIDDLKAQLQATQK